ncbi:11374_t:CDS:2 [Paraglomus occultum]|uniref:11374_t:CDS:1 n=1 Tax=Paraglomus occultum TaxID=144539 RepID=A0A9N8Z2X5_9GLOM|nr:11374_t:CDS:2 [Paraglomus occultum]
MSDVGERPKLAIRCNTREKYDIHSSYLTAIKNGDAWTEVENQVMKDEALLATSSQICVRGYTEDAAHMFEDQQPTTVRRIQQTFWNTTDEGPPNPHSAVGGQGRKP